MNKQKRCTVLLCNLFNVISDIHRNNFNFVSSKRGWFFQNRKIDFFPKKKIFPFGNNC